MTERADGQHAKRAACLGHRVKRIGRLPGDLSDVVFSTVGSLRAPAGAIARCWRLLGKLGRQGAKILWWTLTLQLRTQLTELGASRPTKVPSSRLSEWRRVICRVLVDYRRVHGRMPALLRPRRFTEKMQWRKLFELDPVFAVLSDKLAARDFVTARIGPGRQATLVWAGEDPDAIPFAMLVPPYVLKSTHGSGQLLIVRDTGALDGKAVQAAACRWLAYCHGTALCEPAYIHVPRRLIVERLLVGPGGGAPLEHRVYIFAGRAEIIRTTVPDADGHPAFGDVHSRTWERLPISWGSPRSPVPPSRPKLLGEIIDVAERLGAGLSHCRVDIYDCGDTIWVGELTLYSWSGLTVLDDPASDFLLGAHWKLRWPMLRALRAVAFGRWEIRAPRAVPRPGSVRGEASRD